MNIANEQSRVKWAILAVFQNPNKKLVASKYFLYEGMNTIGSDRQSSEVFLEVDGVSPSHAEITITDEGDAFIEDIGSKQGVYKKASLNPHKKVKLEKGCRYSIVPDQEFYIGKYKCFVVPFDNDYKTGELRRIKEKNEINKSRENSQNKQESKPVGAMDLVETDLDEEQDFNKESNEIKDVQKNGQIIQDPIPEEEHFEKTLELDDKEESDNELFKAANQIPAKAEIKDNDVIEKTLELNSEGEDDKHIDELFETEKQPISTVQNPTEQFEKTLELDSDPDNTKDDHLFSQNSKDQEGQQKQAHQDVECEKTLALSSEGESDHSHLFTNQNEGNEQAVKSQEEDNQKQLQNDQYEKTLELSDKDSDNDNNDLFKTNPGDHYDKTLELSDHSSQDSDNPFGDGKQKDGSKKNESQKDNNSMECEATPPLKDIDSEEDHEKQQQIFEKKIQQPISKAYIYGKQNEKEKQITDVEERQRIGERVRSSYLLKRQSATRQVQQEQPKEQDQNENFTEHFEKQSQDIHDGEKNQKEKDQQAEITVEKEYIEKEKNAGKSEQEGNGMIVEFENKELLAQLSLEPTLVDEEEDIVDQENEQICFSQNTKNNYNSKSLKANDSNNSQNMKNQYSDLQATLMDSPSVSGYSQTAPAGLCSTLIDSPAESNSKPSSKGSKKSRGISPSQQGEDENVMSQKSYKRKSPISLSPTFLDEEVSLSLLQATATVHKSSQGSGKSKQNNESNQLEATLMNTPSPVSGKSPCPSPLASTLIDSPQSSQHQEKDSQEKELMKLKIQQQEEELAKLKELLMKSNFNSNKDVGSRTGGNSERNIEKKIEGQINDSRPQQFNYVINVIAEECHIPKTNQSNVGKGNLSKQQPQPQPIKYSTTLPESLAQKQQNLQKKNINLDKVDDFDDLFGNEDDDENEGKNSKNISNSSCNNVNKLNTSNNASNEEENEGNSRNILDEKSQQSIQQLSRGSKEDSNSVEINGGTYQGTDSAGGASKTNFGGLFNKKCIKRTLTMSASKKILSGEILSTTQPNISNSRAQASPSRGLLFGNRGESSEEVNSKINLMKAQSAPKSEMIPISQSKEDLIEHQALQESPHVFNASEESDSGEDPKKKLKVNSNWGLLKQIKSSGAISKLTDENSSGSVLEKEKPRKIPVNQRNLPKIPESSQKDSEGPSQDQKERQDHGMIIERKGELSVCISGFQLSSEQKKGLKNLKCSISNGIEDDFNILVISEPKRTIKLLLALMKRVPVVTEKWLSDTIKSGNIIQDFQNYYPEGDNFKQRFNGQDIAQLIKRRRSIGQDNLIFEGITFYLSKSLKEPSSQELEVIINAGAGNIRKTLPNKQMKKDQKVFMILSKSDSQLYKACHKLKNVTCATEQLILDAAQNSEFEILPQYIINSQEFFDEEL